MTYRTFVDLKHASLSPRERDIVDSVHKNVVLVRPSGDTQSDTDAAKHARDLAKDGGTIELAPGPFRWSGFIGLYDNTRLGGAGPATSITFTKALDVGIGNIDSSGGNTRLHVSDMRIDGADLVNDPIEFNNVTDGMIDHVWVTQGNHDGIELQNCERCIISNAICHDSNTFSGIELDSCTNCLISNSLVYNNANSGFELDGTASNNVISGGVSWGNTAHGVLMNASTSNNAALNVHAHTNSGFSLIDNGTDNIALLAEDGKIAIGGDSPSQRLNVHARGSGDAFANFSNAITGQTASSGFRVGYDGAGSNALLLNKENAALKMGTNNATLLEMLGSYMYHQAPNAAPADGDIPTQFISFYLDESGNNLLVKAKYSNGTTVGLGTIALV